MMMRDMNRRQISRICGLHEGQIILLRQFQKIKLQLFHSSWCGSWCVHFHVSHEEQIILMQKFHLLIEFTAPLSKDQTEALPLELIWELMWELMWVFKEKPFFGKMSKIILSNCSWKNRGNYKEY